MAICGEVNFSPRPPFRLIDSGNSFTGLMENPSVHITAQDRAAVILVHAGVKPAATMWLYGWNGTARHLEESQKTTAADLLKIGDLRNSRLAGGRSKFFIGFQVARERRLLVRLDQAREEEIGYILGYPKTAVQAYNQGLRRNYDDFLMTKDELRSAYGQLTPFALFRPSRAHCREEMRVVRKWADTIKRVTPGLYEEMLRLA